MLRYGVSDMNFHGTHGQTSPSQQKAPPFPLSRERLRLRRREETLTELKRLRDMMR